LSNILFAGATGAAAPSRAANASVVVADVLGVVKTPPGTDEVAAQALQAAANMAVIGAGELMDATVRQHGKSPSVALNEKQINAQIQQDSKKR
jgi:hypothetical protein